ncbi:SAM-dependent chlorinase/fluorinase [uncultured Oscillibacter sp.]|uniref:SAM hydrolase/SAM-dependent halogenase family protein n=1 Tax=uncultured Oscillibacter sp. TaxID=876091 RepID=UPI0025F026E1|nr:SAM-dependent chlorinase/fluorinase [uncultured Oscillibacter sp.]
MTLVSNRKPCIVWQTDFSRKWGAVASMVGVCKLVDPELECVDITHDLPPYDIWAASMELDYVEPYWPKGTVFVSVVDPGVGTSRKACVALLKDGNYVVTPDNGTLTHLSKSPGIAAVREIDETVNRLKGSEAFSVFHGRDIFAYCAARLASGVISFEGVGPAYPAEDVVLLEDALKTAEVREGAISGIVTSTSDHFGSIVFNIPLAQVAEAGFRHGDTLRVLLTHGGKTVFQDDVLYHKSFGYVAQGAPILFNASAGYLSLGLNQASFTAKYQCGRGGDWAVTVSRIPAEDARL